MTMCAWVATRSARAGVLAAPAASAKPAPETLPSHARRDALALRGEKKGVVASLPAAVRSELDAALRAVLKGALAGDVASPTRAKLAAVLARVS